MRAAGATGALRVATILVNWNGRDVTLACLDSLQRVNYAPHDIIVVDNASADGSLEAIRRDFPGVTVLPMSSNLRYAGGNNAGMRHALDHGADLVLLLNNDTTVAPEFLTALVNRITADPTNGMAAPSIYYFDDPERYWFAGGELSFWTGTMSHTGIREHDDGQYAVAHPIDYATGCCVLVRRDVIEKVGMLDESYFIYAEDADWSMRVRRAGYRIVFEPAAKVWHKVSISSGGHTSWFKMKNKFLSNFRFFARYASWYHWLFFPWMNVVVNGIAATRYLLWKIPGVRGER